MGIIFHVNKKRFLKEIENRRALQKLDMINWYISPDNIVHYYNTGVSESYHYQVHVDKRSEVIRTYETEDGMVLGIDEDEKPEPAPKMHPMAKNLLKLKFGGA